MPELPEVETIVRGLAPYVIGQQIASVEVLLARVVEPDAAIFAPAVASHRVIACRRRAKYIVLDLNHGSSIVIHLRMTGRLIYDADGTVTRPKYTNVELFFANGARLCFADARTFGRMRLVETGAAWHALLGVEPLSDAFTLERFSEILRARTTPIKTFLLDQRHIAGIGNIYACEALWEAEVPPSLPAGKLKQSAVRRLHGALIDVLHRAVEMRGTSARDYVDAEGLKGGFQNVLTVYGRHGEPCRRCAQLIVRTVLSQRGTWWCKTCQGSTRARR